MSGYSGLPGKELKSRSEIVALQWGRVIAQTKAPMAVEAAAVGIGPFGHSYCNISDRVVYFS